MQQKPLQITGNCSLNPRLRKTIHPIKIKKKKNRIENAAGVPTRDTEHGNNILSQSVVVILSRLIGESSKDGEDEGDDDGDRDGDDDSADEEMDGDDEATSEASDSFLLLILTPPSLSLLPALTSLVVM